jgi:hypothetical protein
MKINVNIPDDWPRPWKEVSDGDITIFGYTVLVWKTYKRPARFNIYGFSRGKYVRVWWGRKVIHYVFCLEKIGE